MEYLVLVVAFLAIIFFLYRRYQEKDIEKRSIYIDKYRFPKKVSENIIKTYPHLSNSEVHLVFKGLREYFHICNIAGDNMVSMPSQVVDVAWHEFILFTKKYESFCQNALGRFLHHTPAEAMQSKTLAQDGIKTAWKISCEREKIDINNPEKLPLLFALDAMLNIDDGFKYTLNCMGKNGSEFCASDIGVYWRVW